MNNLPDPIGKSIIQPTPMGTIGIGKESENVQIADTEQGLQAPGQEIELPKEVAAIGVKQQPTVISIPKPIHQLGVKPIGVNIPSQTNPSIVLPLSDNELAMGLHISVVNSFRWLAEWCKKQLKMIGVVK